MQPSTLPPPTTHRAPSLRTPILIAGGLAAAAAVIAVADPRVRHIPLCPLRAITGLDCPLCGGLRSVASLARGRVGEALGYNLVVTVGIPMVIIGLLVWALRLRRSRPFVTPTWVQPALWTVAIVFTVIRNIPAFIWLNSGSI